KFRADLRRAGPAAARRGFERRRRTGGAFGGGKRAGGFAARRRGPGETAERARTLERSQARGPKPARRASEEFTPVRRARSARPTLRPPDPGGEPIAAGEVFPKNHRPHNSRLASRAPSAIA